MNPLFSIVIPVYNVQKLVGRCIESVLSQEIEDIEIILVNDGSTDNSEAICKEYAKRADIVLISKENGGLSSARNTGILHSKGEYILLLDSDDYIEDGCLIQLREVIKQRPADLYTIKARTIYEDGTYYDEHEEEQCETYSVDTYLNKMFNNQKYSACAPYIVYNADFLKSNYLTFYEGILHEDELWTPVVLSKAISICTTNILVYYHCLRKGSITQSKNFNKRGESLIIVLSELLKIQGFEKLEKYKAFRNHWAFLFLEAFIFLNNKTVLRKMYPRIMPYRFSSTSKMKFKSIVYFISPNLYLLLHKVFKR